MRRTPRGLPSIRIDRLAKRYGRGPLVLTEVDLELPPGRVTVVTGGNGSGKSTLLRIVAGLTRPTSGRVLGRPDTVGYVPERFPSRLRMTATDYLRHLAAVRGHSSGAGQALLDRLGFAGDRRAPMDQLSKGNTQKVALAQAMQTEVDLLVLDEPWAGLDRTAATELGELVGETVGRGTLVLITDHGGHAQTATGAHGVRLVGGTLVAGAVNEHLVDVVLVCPPDAVDAVLGLPGVHAASVDAPLANLRVTVGASDALLAEALRLGCSVRGVVARESAGEAR